MIKTTSTPRTRKVRRRSAGGKPSRGWELQRAGRKVRRADVRKLRIGETDAKLTTVGGLVSFNAFAREQGLPGELRRRFGRLKTGASVVYPMGAQMQLLLDMSVAGGQRVFDLEMLAADQLGRQVVTNRTARDRRWARGSQGSASPWDRLWASYPPRATSRSASHARSTGRPS